MKQFKQTVKTFSGAVLLIFVAIGALTYFSNKISVSTFVALAFMVATAVLIFAYYGWLTVRSSLMFVITVGVLLIGITFFKPINIKSNQFQAVFLANGQVYFGHLENANTQNPTLKNIYYFKANQQNSQAGNTEQTTQTQLSVVKLGSEIYGPEDKMTIKSDQILFWENLKNDSKIVQYIKNNEQKK